MRSQGIYLVSTAQRVFDGLCAIAFDWDVGLAAGAIAFDWDVGFTGAIA
ncbi:hypothetical protein [Moorena sp. SIO4A1]|nr:hypothetical protein [Moorena sp. SIO4A1]